MRKCRQVKFIHGKDLDDLENKINQALMEGAELGGIDIPSLIGAVVVTEYVGEIAKTKLDELEEIFGRHVCGECPFFMENPDRRCKWHECERTGKKVLRSSRCCETFYRNEEKYEISEDQGKNERVRFEGRGCRGMAQGVPASGLRQTQWSEQIPTLGMRITVDIPQDATGRVV